MKPLKKALAFLLALTFVFTVFANTNIDSMALSRAYRIKFVGNGATSGSMKSVAASRGKTVTLPANRFQKTGYTFTGWNTKKNGTGKKYANKAKVKNLTAGGKTVTLYARWRKNTYKITYKLNGGTNHKSNPKQYTVTTKTVTLKNPTYKGYTFKGWYSDAKYKKKVTKIAKGSTGNKTLYAKWQKNTYQIVYKLNGGKNNAKNPKTYTVTTATVTLQKPTRAGYSFQGWYADAGFKKKVTGIPKGSTGAKTFYAKWTAASFGSVMAFQTDAVLTDQFQTTVLLFGRPGCYNTTSTLCSLAQANWLKTENVKIFFVDVYQNSATTIKTFAQEINDSRITFCYDTTGAAKELIWTNLGSGSFSLPIILYFNRDGEVVISETGIKTADQILSSVKKAAASSGTLQTQGESSAEINEQALVLVNKARKEEGLSAVRYWSEAQAAADQRAKELSDSFSHTRPDGRTCFTILKDYGFRYLVATENIAGGYTTTESVVQGWLHSEGHRANILNPDVTAMVIGRYKYFWVQIFVKPY